VDTFWCDICFGSVSPPCDPAHQSPPSFASPCSGPGSALPRAHGLPLPLSHTCDSRTPLISHTDEPQAGHQARPPAQDAGPPATGPGERLPKGGVRSALQPWRQRPRRPIAWRHGSTKARRAFIMAPSTLPTPAPVKLPPLASCFSVHR